MADDVEAPRKVWDLEEAEKKYAERLERERQEAKDEKKKKAAGGKVPPPLSTGSSNSVQARTEAVIKTEELRGKRELVAPSSAFGIKGRSAGFYCEVCDVTYKDSFSYLDHINSSTHYRRLGISGKVERATLEDVKARLAWLKQRKADMDKERDKDFTLSKRIAERRRLEEEEKHRRREKKKAKRRARRQAQMGSDQEMAESNSN